MQVQKAKTGYKIVKSLFGKHEEIPQEWDVFSLTENGLLILSSGKSIENIQEKGKYPVYGSNGIIGYTDNYNEGDAILIGRVGASGSIHYLDHKAWITDNVLISKLGYKLNKKFTYYALKHLNLQRFATKSAQPLLTQSILKVVKIKTPPIKEQQKIASSLSNVDSLINQTQKEIEQTQRLKKGLMQKLLTKGIGHTKFKSTNLGKPTLNVTIPENWQVKQLKSVIIVENNSIDLKDDEFYKRIIVKRRHEGIELRDVVKGKEILTKNQFEALSGQFIISRRQIIHNACCMIPDSFNNSVVSNEYSIFSGSEFLLINYLDWFSQTRLFKNMIILTTHGVQLEKYVFKLEEWLKLFIPLPSLEEQQKIVSILSNVDSKIQKQQEYKSKLETLKKGLMQKLLTGQIRVKV